MAGVKSPLRIRADELCAAMPKANSRTLARRLADEFGEPIEKCRTAVRMTRGAHGRKKEREATVIYKRKGKSEAAKVPKVPPTQLPESLAEPWEPFEVQPGKVLLLSDIHIPYHSVGAVEAAIKLGKSINPSTVLLNGDIADFYQVSRWEKNPKRRKFKEEKSLVVQFLRYIREQFPKSEIIYKYGNHEERFDKYVWNNAPALADCEEMLLSEWLKLSDYGIQEVYDQRPIMLGALPVFHGHELPKGMTSPVNQARGAFLRMLDTVMVSHGHRSSSHTEPNWQHTETTCWSTGCLCDMSAEYARINKWNWGFAWIEHWADKSFDAHNLRVNKDYKVRPA